MTKKISTYHLHTTFCDGKNTAEEMLLEAIRRKCPEIGFSVHSPFDFKSDWAIRKERVNEYVETIEGLREKYGDKIKIYIGIEQDYFSPEPDWAPDYIIGAVHYILKDGNYLALDLSADEMKENIDKYYGGDVYAYCEDYYDLLCDVVNKTKCDIVAHFDLVTKFNEKMPLIDENHPRYLNAVNKAIKALKDSDAYFEVNVGAITRGYRTKPYPSEYIMMELMTNGKPFVLNSDTHSTFTLDMHLDAYARIFDNLGIKYITSLDEIL